MTRKYASMVDAFADPELFCSAAVALMVDKLGAESMNWEPETLEAEFRTMGINPGDDLMDRLHAGATILTTNQFHTDFGAFCALCATLNRGKPSFDRLEPPSLDDVAWACAESRLLEGTEVFDSQGFSEDISNYVGQLLSDSGVTKPPDILKFAEMGREELENRDKALGTDEFEYKAYWDSHDELLKGVEADIKAKALELAGQLARLPLTNGDPEFLTTLPTA